LFFFLICFFTEEVSNFLGQKIQKHVFVLKKYFPKLFLPTNIYFHCFFFTVELRHFFGTQMVRNISVQNNLENIFLEKNMFLNFFVLKK
jgi:hypothetical protein